jgi:tyrosine-protein kinase Etk/Wzc
MDTLEQAEQESARVARPQKSFDLFDFLLVLSEFRRTIALSIAISTALGVLVCIFSKPIFTATAIILPPQQGQSLAAMMGQLGALVSLTGMGGSSGGALKTPSDLYIGILESRTIADNVISRFHLQQLYQTRKMEDTRSALKNNSRFLSGKDGLIHISFDDHDPNRASEVANAYVDELYSMNSHLAITEAAQRRAFFDQELADEKSALTVAEDDLKKVAEKTGIIHLGGQAESIIRGLALLRAEIASREVEIDSMRMFATDQNPVAIRAREEINSLRQQLAKLENDPRNPELSDTVGIPAERMPAISLEYARKFREVKYHEALYELLAKQYEAARIDEAKAAPIIQVVDRAVPPDKKSGPHRLWILLGCGFIGFVVGYVIALISRALHRAAQIPEYAVKLGLIRHGLRFSRG